MLKTLGNFNNEIGLPLTVFRLTEDDEVAVLEMGISDFGEMDRLSKIAQPDICVITNIGLCHLENLGTRDGILKAKTEIFKSMNPDGTVILNGDDDKLITIKDVYDKKPVFFGIENKCGIYAENIVNNGLEGMMAAICNVNTADNIRNFNVHIPVAGIHMVYNSMAAAAVGAVFGLTSKEIADGIANMETLAGRNHIIRTDSFNCISSFEKELKAIDKAILQTVQGLNPEEYTVLNSIPGIGKVYSAGILAEIGSIKAFQNANQLAKYCGIVWNDNDSGDFESEDSRMSKAGNRYLRYYIIEATGSVISHCPEYKAFYQKKYAETRNHQHKRALALTSRKFIRLLFGLLDKGQLYSPEKGR